MAPPPYPYPYIMDPPLVEKKVGETMDVIPTPKLREIIVEMSRGYQHIYETMGHCSRNVDRIIANETPFPYPAFDPPVPPNDSGRGKNK